MNLPPLDRLTVLAFFTSVLLGGLNAIGVRYTVLELPPFWGAAVRFAAASLLLFALARALRLPLPRGRSLTGAVLYGVVSFGINYAFLYWGLQRADAGTAQVVLALVPLLTLFFAVAHRQERLTGRALAGSLLAVAGIAVVFGQGARADTPLPYLLALAAAAVFFAWGNVIYKRFPMGHPVMTNAVAMGTGFAVLLGMSLAFGEPWAVPTRPETWAALGYLVVFGSCVVFILALYVLNRWTASATSYAFVLLPVVTVTVSAWMERQPLPLALLLGAALVMAGVYIGALRRPRAALPAGAATPAD